MAGEHLDALLELRERLIEERRFLVKRTIESKMLPSQNPLLPDISDIQNWIGAITEAIRDEMSEDASSNEPIVRAGEEAGRAGALVERQRVQVADR